MATERQAKNHPSMTGLSTVKNSPRYSFMGRRELGPKPRALTPDSWSYDPLPDSTSKMNRSPQFGFGSSSTRRLAHEQEKAPGPGAYAQRRDWTPRGFSPGQAPRNKERASSQQPAPGQYGNVDPTKTSKMRTTRGHGFSSGGTGRMDAEDQNVPGPGSYAVSDELNASRKGVVFSTSSRKQEPGPAKHKSPSPGEYVVYDPCSTSKMKKSNVYRFSSADTGRLESSTREAAPGPGAYTQQGDGGVKGGAFAHSPREREKTSRSLSPAPGSYEPADPSKTSRMSSSMVSSMATKTTGRMEQEKTAAPGPGSYQHKDLVANPGKGLSFPGSPRRTGQKAARGESPEPGDYSSVDPTVTSKMSKVAAHAFASQSTGRTEASKQLAPGPGAYTQEPSGSTTNGPAFDRAPRQVEKKRESRTPPPGAYSPVDPAKTSSMSSSTAPSLPRQATGRMDAEQQSVPGPGAYAHKEHVSAKEKGVSFPASPRHKPRNLPATPDPGQYAVADPKDTSKMHKEPAFKFPSSDTGRMKMEKHQSPGPGSYIDMSPRDSLGSSRAVVFPTSARQVEKKESTAPAPGTYSPADPSVTSTMSSSLAASLSKQATGRMEMEVHAVPGPGAYEHKEHVTAPETGISFGTSARHKEVSASCSPDPGQYQVVDPTSTSKMGKETAFKFPGADTGRMAMEEHELPGPGAYGHEARGDLGNSQGISFDHAPRQVEKKSHATIPPPGHYEPADPSKTSAMSSAVAPSMAKESTKRLEMEVHSVPGPGQYEHKEHVTSTENAISFSTAPRHKEVISHCFVPPVGAYSPNDPSKTSLMSSPVVASFEKGSTGRLEMEPHLVPGPGAYQHKEHVTSQDNATSFSTAPRQKERPAEPSPDPGQYQVADPTDTRMSRELAFKFPTSDTGRMAMEKHDIPGPGSYSHAEGADVGSNGGFAFDKAPRQVEKTSPATVPPPGAYEPVDPTRTSSMARVAAASLGKETTGRMEMEPHLVPGPGAYAHKEHVTAQENTISFSTAPRQKESRSAALTPAPGTYEPADPSKTSAMASSLAATLGKETTRRMEMVEHAVPGPGAYEHREHVTSQDNAISFSTAPRQKEQAPQTSPDPGQYTVAEPHDTSKMSRAPMFKFPSGDTGRMAMEKHDNPGPGSYSHAESRDVGSSGGIVFDHAPRQVEKREQSMVPAPGTYEHVDPGQTSSMSRTSAAVLSTKSTTGRMEMEPHHVPGPGAYEHKEHVTTADRAISFPTAPRQKEPLHPEVAPAPGQYDVKDPSDTGKMSSQPTFKFPVSDTGRLAVEQQAVVPGPGHYSHVESADVGNSGGITFEHAPRHVEKREQTVVPPPGAYEHVDPGRTSSMSGAVSASIDKSSTGRMEMVTHHVPGPGAYEHKEHVTSLDTAVSFPTAPRQKERPADRSPEPGDYQVADPSSTSRMNREPTFKFPASDTMRMSMQKQEVPGPGQYSHAEQGDMGASGGTGFGHAPRQIEKLHPEVAPAPGTYEHVDPGKTSAMSSALAPSLNKQSTGRMEMQPDAVPGPGQYEHKEHVTAAERAICFPTAPRHIEKKEQNPVPAPGTYDPADPSSTSLMSSAVAPSMNKQSTGRMEMQPHNVPGPGQYEHREHVTAVETGTSFPIAARHVEKREQTHVPPPGAYEPVDPGRTSSMSSSVTATLPKQSTGRMEMQPHHVPGPGHYEHPEHVTAVENGISFPTSARQVEKKEKSYVPPPGTYEAVDPGRTSSMSSAITASLPKQSTGRMEMQPHDVPGPGQYEHPEHVTAVENGISFPTSARHIERKESDMAPSPGHYEAVDPGRTSSMSSAVTATLAKQSTGRMEMEPHRVPGPGHYDHQEHVTAPDKGISFPTTSRHIEKKEQSPVPPPGTYEHVDPSKTSSMSSAVAPAMNKQSTGRMEMEPHLVPGPGQYDHQEHVTAPDKGISFPVSARHIEKKEQSPVPPPGTYEHVDPSKTSSMSSAVAPVMNKQSTGRMEMEPHLVPGPGQYEHQEHVTSMDKAISFPVAGRHIEKSEQSFVPPPGTYEHVDPGKTSSMSSAVAPVMNKQSTGRMVMEPHSVPGPGQYEHQEHVTSLDKAISFPVSGRPTEKKEAGGPAPAPGSYEAVDPSRTSLMSSALTPSMAKTSTGRMVMEPHHVPGPGQYEHQEHVTAADKGMSFPISARQVERKEASVVPAPGTYEHVDPGKTSSMSSAITATLPKQSTGRMEMEPHHVPGPGQYEHQEHVTAPDRGISFPTSARQVEVKGPIVPPVGTYEAVDPGRTSSMSSAIASSIDKSSTGRMEMEPDKVPGPGAYEHKEHVSANETGTRFPIAARIIEKIMGTSWVPSPGAYNPPDPSKTSQMSSAAAVSIDKGSTGRMEMQPDTVPGPGQYEHPEHVTALETGMKFPVAPRQKEKIGETPVPPPGAYEAVDPSKTSIMSGAAGGALDKSTTGRMQMEPQTALGPGAYDHREHVTSLENGVSFNTAARQPKHKDEPMPAPGQYEVGDPMASKMENQPAFKFSSSDTGRMAMEVHAIPGPGAYEHVSNGDVGHTNGISFDHAARVREALPSSTPAPGAYEHVDPSKTSLMSSGGGVAIDKQATGRMEQQPDAVPGPGEYSHREHITAQETGHTFSSGPGRERSERSALQVSPDPGKYDPADPHHTSQMRKQPSHSFASGSTGRMEMQEHAIPGPGAYSPQEHRAEQGSFDQAPRTRERTDSRPSSPGPGMYDPADPTRTSSMSAETSYSLAGGDTGRMSMDGKQSHPGPGAYEHQEGLSTSSGGASFSTAARQKEKSNDGSSTDFVVYDPSVTSKMKKDNAHPFSIAQTGRMVLEQHAVPGPGAYTAAPGQQVAGGAIGREPRHRLRLGQAGQEPPGPGTYSKGYVPPGSNGPRFSMQGRPAEKPENSPGPGHYGGHYTQFAPPER